MEEDDAMPTFIVLGNLTDQGRRTIMDSPARLDVVKAVLRRLGGNLKEFHLTMGQYDFVMTLEAPDDETVTSYLLAVETQGHVKTVTLRAFPEGDFRKMIKGPK
jgi:uncharacterized protein with GYD domain